MYIRYFLTASIVVVSALLISLPSSAEDSPGKEKIDKLIEQLGSGNFAEREAASKDLSAIGVPALQALRTAAKSEDAEVRKRAEELLPKIERQAESARILAPRRVHLVYKDTPLEEAAADFRKKSGYTLHLHDPDGKLKERKVTLDSGETSFWRAVALFCAKAELAEASIQDLMQARQQLGDAPPAPPAVPRRRGGPGAPPVPIQPPRALMPGMSRQLILKDAKTRKLPTDDRSAVRIRALNQADLFESAPKGEIVLPLEVSPEPKLQWQAFQSIHIEKAVDDQGQTLAQVVPQVEGGLGIAGGNGLPGNADAEKIRQMQLEMAIRKQRQRQAQLIARQRMGWGGLAQLVPVQFKKGAKDAKSLKELKGTLTAQVLTEPRPVIATDPLDKAAGKTFKGKEGGSIKIVDVSADENRTTIRAEFDPPPSNSVLPAFGNIMPGNGIAIGMGRPGIKPPAIQAQIAIRRGAFGGAAQLMDSMNGLTVQDDKGNTLSIDGSRSRMQASFERQANGRQRHSLTYTLVCVHDKEKGKPAKVVYLGRKRATVEIPFALKNVPLP